MTVSSIKGSGMSAVDFAQFKLQTLSTMLGSNSDDTSSTDLFSGLPNNVSDIFQKYLGTAPAGSSDTSVIPTATDTIGAFSTPGQNVSTVINRVDVSFKAQFSELSELKSRIAQQQDAANTLHTITPQSSDADIVAKVNDFIATYNAGVNRFTPDVAAGGVLDGSAEANRARFSLERDIADPLIGASSGVRDGLASLGIQVDPTTLLATVDQTALQASLGSNKNATVNTLTAFAASFSATATSLNQAGNPEDRQLKNLDKAIHWIDDNRADVAKEFGAGEAAKPNQAFAKAAAAYYVLMAKQPT